MNLLGQSVQAPSSQDNVSLLCCWLWQKKNLPFNRLCERATDGGPYSGTSLLPTKHIPLYSFASIDVG